jgi:superfamily II DNA or RNA helicase
MITIHPKNAVHVLLEAEPSILLELREYFTFQVPGARHMPAFKNKMWDGKIRIFNPMNRLLYVGLVDRLKTYASTAGIPVTDLRPSTKDLYSTSEVEQFISALPLRDKGDILTPRDYQISSVTAAIATERMIVVSPTGSGKSLMLYLMMRWYHAQGKQQLLIVPTQSLVEQMYSDFQNYASDDPSFQVDQVCQRIYQGFSKEVEVPIVISTWQSIFKLPPAFFANFDVLYGDEAHLFKAKSLVSLLEKTTTTPIKIATTGTLDGAQVHEWVLEGLFGEQHQVVTTKDLMEQDHLAELSIRIVVLKHPDVIREGLKRATYDEEIKHLTQYSKRNKFIRNLALSLQGNTLVLFRHVETHGRVLYDLVREAPNAPEGVFFIHGKVPVSEREAARQQVEESERAIVLASYGTFSTGINIRNIHNIILATPSKSRILNLQSIGRGLRRSATKSKISLFDVADDLSWKRRKNHTLKHLVERLEIYSSEQFSYTIDKIDL